MINGIMNCHHYQANDEGLRQPKGFQCPTTLWRKDPEAHIMTPAQYMKAVCEGQIPCYGQPQNLGEYGGQNEGLAIGGTTVNYCTTIR